MNLGIAVSWFLAKRCDALLPAGQARVAGGWVAGDRAIMMDKERLLGKALYLNRSSRLGDDEFGGRIRMLKKMAIERAR
ncbi:hypothetical protein SAMN05444161_8505 [Rhizobiales bacterium GAS191]|nr:hypothetical protein SAMN05444161_8505 [Rhizobiales bacterium GAS191]